MRVYSRYVPLETDPRPGPAPTGPRDFDQLLLQVNTASPTDAARARENHAMSLLDLTS